MSERANSANGKVAPAGADLDCAEIGRMEHPDSISYSVKFGRDVLKVCLPDLIRDRKVLVVTTPTVLNYFGKSLVDSAQGRLSAQDFLVLDCKEASKDLRQVQRVCSRASSALDRTGLIIGFGGGVVMDIANFAASMIDRGIGHVKIPTTLIGQVDAAIGIKGGVNFEGRKSFLGCFRAPEVVLIEPSFLRRLPLVHLASGCAEMIKMAIIADAVLFDALDARAESWIASGFSTERDDADRAIIRAVSLMLEALRGNLTERKSYRRAVDFGHTFSPALEAALGFSIPHGFAVAIDIALSSAIACETGMATPDVLRRVAGCLQNAGLPVWHPALSVALCQEAILTAAAHRGGNLNLVVPTIIGSPEFLNQSDAVTPAVLVRALALIEAMQADLR